MNDVYSIVAAALGQDANVLRAVSQNVSNMGTAGYKREVFYQQAFSKLFESRAGEGLDADLSAGVQKSKMLHAFDTSTGTLKKTGRALDVAVAGDGYFEIQLSDGPAYTRQGNFRLDAEGRLVTERGDPVLGTNGAITLTTENISIGHDGEVKDGDRVIAHLKLVVPGDLTHAEHVAPGMIRTTLPVEAVDASRVNLRQAYLENSNVSLVNEMVQMMQTMRHFESVQRVAQQFDELMGNSIKTLGEV